MLFAWTITSIVVAKSVAVGLSTGNNSNNNNLAAVRSYHAAVVCLSACWASSLLSILFLCLSSMAGNVEVTPC